MRRLILGLGDCSVHAREFRESVVVAKPRAGGVVRIVKIGCRSRELLVVLLTQVD